MDVRRMAVSAFVTVLGCQLETSTWKDLREIAGCQSGRASSNDFQ